MNTKTNGNVQWLGIRTVGESQVLEEAHTPRIGGVHFFVQLLHTVTHCYTLLHKGHALIYKYFLHACYTLKKSLQKVNI